MKGAGYWSPALGTGTGTRVLIGDWEGEKMPEPFARERVLASQFEKSCPLPQGKRDELAELLANYREELKAVWPEEARKRARRGG